MKKPIFPTPNKEKIKFIKFILSCFGKENVSDDFAEAWANANHFSIYQYHSEPLDIITTEIGLLNPNRYTEERNPILSTLFHTIVNDNLGNNSDEVKALMKENKAEEKFTETLTSKQLELYNEAFFESCSINTKIEAERFIFGFKFALMLFKEGFNL